VIVGREDAKARRPAQGDRPVCRAACLCVSARRQGHGTGRCVGNRWPVAAARQVLRCSRGTAFRAQSQQMLPQKTQGSQSQSLVTARSAAVVCNVGAALRAAIAVQCGIGLRVAWNPAMARTATRNSSIAAWKPIPRSGHCHGCVAARPRYAFSWSPRKCIMFEFYMIFAFYLLFSAKYVTIITS
jgi:hypothetical protein